MNYTKDKYYLFMVPYQINFYEFKRWDFIKFKFIKILNLFNFKLRNKGSLLHLLFFKSILMFYK